MQSILTTFGIDWRLLLVNALNFGLLLLALWYFLYTPLMNLLEERRKKVIQGVEDAEAAAAERKAVESSRAHVLAEAGKEADSVLSAARSAATKREREGVAAGEAAAAAVLKDAEAQAEEMKREAIAESKQEVAKLIVLGMEKALTK